jgi:RND family efflux transporter MFP subunit
MRIGLGRALFAAALITTLVGCSSDSDVDAERPRVVDTAVVRAANGAADVTLSGRVVAAEKTRLSFEISGQIERLSVDVGERFEAGDVLAALDDSRYRLVEQRATASAQEAKASLHEARLAFERQQQLREKGFVSEAALDNAQAKLDTARSRYQSAQASRRLAQRDLRLTELTAPFDGSVSERRVEPLERVSPNQPVLDVISDREGFEVETSLSETLVERLITGSHHQVVVPSLGETPIEATVRHVGSQPRSSNNYPVILELAEAPPGLRSGMTAQVRLALAGPARDAGDTAGNPAGAVRVPLTALVYDGPTNAHVMRLDREQRLQAVPVEVLVAHQDVATVTGDLKAGQHVVARGAEFVAEGQRVEALNQGAERYN